MPSGVEVQVLSRAPKLTGIVAASYDKIRTYFSRKGTKRLHQQLTRARIPFTPFASISYNVTRVLGLRSAVSQAIEFLGHRRVVAG